MTDYIFFHYRIKKKTTEGYIFRPHGGCTEEGKRDPTVCTLLPSGQECGVSVESLLFRRAAIFFFVIFFILFFFYFYCTS